MWAIGKVIIAAIIISFTSWLAGRRPALAGFLIALPISSSIALAMVQIEFGDVAKTAAFGRSIAISLPLSLMFFIPYFLQGRLQLPFGIMYGGGMVLLGVAYLIHRSLVGG